MAKGVTIPHHRSATGPSVARRGGVRAAGRVVVAMLTLVACGGSNDETSEGPPTAASVPATSPQGSGTTAATESSAAISTLAATTDPPASVAATVATAPNTPRLAARIPNVEGFQVREVPSDDLLWRFVDLPTTFAVHHGIVHGPDGERVARIVVAAGPSIEPPIEEYVASSFDAPWQFPRDTTTVDDSENTFVVTNEVQPSWTNVDGGAVLVGTLPETAVTQWAWGADDLVWIVRGDASAEPFVRGLLAQHVASLDPFDTQGMTGSLWDHTPALDGYDYRDLPREDTLAVMPFLLVPDCAERVYVGYLKEEDAADIMFTAGDMQLALVKVGRDCVDGGYLGEISSAVAAQPGWSPSTIAGTDVWRTPTTSCSSSATSSST